MEQREKHGRSVEIQSFELMGIFLLVFGMMVVVAAFFPMDLTGKIANVIVGFLLTAIGGILLMKGRSHKRRLRQET